MATVTRTHAPAWIVSSRWHSKRIPASSSSTKQGSVHDPLVQDAIIGLLEGYGFTIHMVEIPRAVRRTAKRRRDHRKRAYTTRSLNTATAGTSADDGLDQPMAVTPSRRWQEQEVLD